MPIWIKSFPELVKDAGDFWRAHQYVKASQSYLFAAHVAPSEMYETSMLIAAWKAHERAAGRKSELEAA